MFTQFRQAVENLAPQPRRGSDAAAGDEQRELASRPNSLDSHGRPSSPLSSSQLAESALLNLRKSLATQRTSSSSSSQKSAGAPASRSKSTLEDRLRAATFAITEASNATSPDVSASTVSSLTGTTTGRSLSPSSTPLPTSPPLSPTTSASPPTPLIATAIDILTPQSTQEPRQAVIEDEAQDPPSTCAEGAEMVTQLGKPPEDAQTPEAQGAPAPHSVSSPNMENLQERLKEVEQRFTDVSTSFKRLQAEKAAADAILHEFIPLHGIRDNQALRDYLKNMSSEAESLKGEIRNLGGKLERQETRTQELRDVHRLESTSQSDQVETLRTQLKEAETLLKAVQDTDARAEQTAAKNQAEMERLQGEVERAKLLAKEEEEKRIKAISLLKTVRQKLVKAEKEKDDALKELGSSKQRESNDRDSVQAERMRFQSELDAVNVEREKAVTGLKAQFDKEVTNIRERHEKEIYAQRDKYETEGVSIRNAHFAELSSTLSRISTLETSLNNTTKEKNVLFDHLQLRQAELESAQSHLESLQSQMTELEYQLRETSDQHLLLKEDMIEAHRELENRSREPVSTAGEVARLLSAAEAKYDSKLSELKKHISVLEKERNDGEADWSRKLRDKAREVEDLKRDVGSVARTRQHDEEIINGLKAEISQSKDESLRLQQQVNDLRLSHSKVKDVERLGKTQELELNTRVSALERQIEDNKQRETQLRLANKTLREELRKVQSSAALLERQRNPGVGYWTSRTADTTADTRTSLSSASSDPPSRVGSPISSPTTLSTNDEEVNLEYLRNVILQFLEHKEMRPNLVRVLSIILRFTPHETRRLIAKV